MSSQRDTSRMIYKSEWKEEEAKISGEITRIVEKRNVGTEEKSQTRPNYDCSNYSAPEEVYYPPP